MHRITFLPFESCVKVPSKSLLLEAVKRAGLPVRASCGGKGTCGNCAVQILKGSFQKKSSSSLSDELASQGFSLACQTEVRDDLTVFLPQFQELSVKAVTDSPYFRDRKEKISGFYETNPPLKKINVTLPSPTLENNSSDLRRVERVLKQKISFTGIECSYTALKKLAIAARKDNGNVTLLLFTSGGKATILDLWPKCERKKILGISCDIGTSTVALHLVDLETGRILETASSCNQQIKCGEDIISRIHFAQRPGGQKELHSLILNTIHHLVEKTVKASRAAPEDICYAAFSGNTTMIHLFLNLEPRFIREEPYVPTFNQVPVFLARDVGLRLHPEARMFCAPAVGSYVGGDIAAGLLCTPMLKDSERISLFIDAGTNGEIVVGNKDWLMTCACSAGPAFEGGGIRCGMPASEGAIDSVKFLKDGTPRYSVIGNSLPKGLCGSGLVDLLAELFIHGYIDRYGKFKETEYCKRFVQSEEGKAFRIEEGENSYWGKDLLITEKDIAALIRTKGAVFSACSLLLKNVGLTFEKIDSIFIAGGFGKSLNVENAVRIGLLPDLEREKFHYVGNSSLMGAHLILLSDRNKNLADQVSLSMTYMELMVEPRYMNEYTGSLFLPHTDMNLFPSVEKITLKGGKNG